MITKKEKQMLKKIFGHRYSPIVEEYLKQFGIKNEDGSDVSREMIRQVTNNFRQHKVIEEGIIKAAETHKQKLNISFKRDREKRKILFQI